MDKLRMDKLSINTLTTITSAIKRRDLTGVLLLPSRQRLCCIFVMKKLLLVIVILCKFSGNKVMK